jgi:hypothetical protein
LTDFFRKKLRPFDFGAVLVRDPNVSCYRHWVTIHMMRQKETTAAPTSLARQIGPVKKKKKQAREIQRQRGDGLASQCALEPVARALSSRTCSQTSKLGDSLDQRALEPVARALSSGTCSQTSKLGDSLDQRALEPVVRALSSRTCSQTSKLGDSLDQRALEPVARALSSRTCS